MDSVLFDRWVRVMREGASRSGVLRSDFAAVAGFGITSMLSPEHAEAKKRKKKVKLCHSGQTITVGKKKKKKHLKHGDTPRSLPDRHDNHYPPGGRRPGHCATPGASAPRRTSATFRSMTAAGTSAVVPRPVPV